MDIKKIIMFFWSNNCVLAVLPIVTLPTLVEKLILAHGVKNMGQCGPNASMDILDKTKSQGPFGMDQMSPWVFWTGPNVL